MSSSGMAGLRQPVVGSEAQPADALGDRRLPGAHDDRQTRSSRDARSR